MLTKPVIELPTGPLPAREPDNKARLIKRAMAYVDHDMRVYLKGMSAKSVEALLLTAILEIPERDAACVLGISRASLLERLSRAREIGKKNIEELRKRPVQK